MTKENIDVSSNRIIGGRKFKLVFESERAKVWKHGHYLEFREDEAGFCSFQYKRGQICLFVEGDTYNICVNKMKTLCRRAAANLRKQASYIEQIVTE